MKSVRILVIGRVQGVWFRQSAWREAIRLGVKGCVRNTEDGNVEIFAEGAEAAIRQFVAWCRQGPPFSKVDSISVEDAKPQNYKDFSVV